MVHSGAERQIIADWLEIPIPRKQAGMESPGRAANVVVSSGGQSIGKLGWKPPRFPVLTTLVGGGLWRNAIWKPRRWG